jgi:outer membrane protein OmpA-like peptidoglycan-associated protein
MNKLLLTAILLLFAYCASAQKIKQEVVVEETDSARIETITTTDKYKVETNYFFENWFASFGIGAQFYMGDNEKHMRFKDLLTPAIDLSVGKWFSPGLGLQVSYSGYKLKGLWADHYAGQHFKTDIEYTNPKKNYKGTGKLYEQKANFFNLHVEGLLNLSNLIGGYKEKRIYSIIPYVGVGWIRGNNHPERHVDDITFNGGIINSFRLSNSLDLNVTIRGAIVNDGFDGEISGNNYIGPAGLEPENYKGGGQNYFFDGYGGITVGLTYKFKQRGWNKARSVKSVYSNDEDLLGLQNEIIDLQAQNEALRNTPSVIVEEKENIVITFPYLVNFVIDEVEVVNREKVNLNFVAEMMKTLPQKRFVLSGYADKYTGTTDRNIWLAENRAKNVYKILTEEFGVSAEQLKIEYYGGVDNMYYSDPQLSRSVVITEIE